MPRKKKEVEQVQEVQVPTEKEQRLAEHKHLSDLIHELNQLGFKTPSEVEVRLGQLNQRLLEL